MSKIDTMVSAITNGTYGMPNSIVGQIKTILLNDPNVSVVSDNDPDNTTMRVLIYSVASQGHHFKIATTSETLIGFSTLKLDCTTYLIPVANRSIVSDTSYSVRLLYNAKAHFFMMDATPETSCVCLDCGDATNGWYLKGFGSFGINNVFCNSSNYSMLPSYACYGSLDNSGQFVGVPARFSIGGRLTDYYYDYFYGTSEEVGTGFYTSGGHNYLSLSRAFILSDQVPS
jgi:hypothetical protein